MTSTPSADLCGWNGCRNRVSATSTTRRCWLPAHRGPEPGPGAHTVRPHLRPPQVITASVLGDDWSRPWPEGMTPGEVAAWSAAGFSADDAADWRAEWDVPLVLAAHWRDSGFGPDDELLEPGYRPVPFDDSPRDANYGPRECCSTEHPMLNRANTTHLLASFAHPDVYLEPDQAETFFHADRASVGARIRTHDGTQVGYLYREVVRDEDDTWSLDNHKLMLGGWDEDRNELATGPGLQGRGIGTAIAAHCERELKALMPELTRVTTFSVDDVPGLGIGGYQNARRGFDFDPDLDEWDDRRRELVPVTPRQQVRRIWERGGRDRLLALRDAGHISADRFDQAATLLTATRGKVPSPRALSELGADAPFTLAGRVTHLGKELLLGSEWHGDKRL